MPNTREKLIERLPIDDAIRIFQEEFKHRSEAYTTHLSHGGKGDPAEEVYIDALAMAASALERTKWIPVTERLPENDGKFLGVVNEEGYNRIAFVYYSDRRWWDCFYNGFVNVKLTHWMPIPNMPEPPKGE